MTKEEFELRVGGLRGQLIALARARLPQSESEDAVQNSILNAWIHLDQLKDECTFEPWIKRILLNECAQILRSKKRQQDIARAMVSANEEAAHEESIPIYEALEKLNPADRELLLLHHDQGYSIREIAEKANSSEDVLKMRLYRARNRLRVILISMLILLLGMAIAIGTGRLDISWFLSNRRAEPAEIATDQRSAIDISYDGRYLAAEVSDAFWDLEALELLFTYSLAGIFSDSAVVHSGNIGVDGERHDHIWVNDQILPVDEWAQGRMVYTYSLDGWRLGSRYLNGSEDYLPDGKGESFFAALRLDTMIPDAFNAMRTDNGKISLECDLSVRDYESNEIVEEGTMTISVDAPNAEEWRAAYETYYR